MRTVLIVPARYQSTRFPGKPLALVGGKTLIQRTWEIACSVSDDVFVATDDSGIEEVVEFMGGRAVATPGGARNGTERCAYAAQALRLAPEDVVINLQGDSCLMPPEYLVDLMELMGAEDSEVGTVGQIPHRLWHPGDVGVWVDKGLAWSFGRYNVEYATALHLGVYGYRVDALRAYMEEPPDGLEEREGLEQLRWLHRESLIQRPIRVVVETERRDIHEVNRPEDIPLVEAVLRSEGRL